MIASIFLGPTMSVDEARLILPQGVFRPPAAQGDLLYAAEYDKADIIGLVDGTFHQNLSVWHNEVCYLLSRGVTIYGSSSMGALRAVETESFGTRGVGAIYKWYRDEIITGDDEVALIHGDASCNFRSFSLPMVNIRASIALAVAKGLVIEDTGRRVIETAKSINYQERALLNILEQCRRIELSEQQLTAVRTALTEEYVDQKKEDARELLELIAAVIGGSIQRPSSSQFVFARSSVFETLYNLDREIRVKGRAVSQQEIAEYTALHCPEFKKLRRSSLDRSLVVFFAGLLDIRISDTDIAAERVSFCEDNQIESPETLENWLSDNCLCEKDFIEYLAQEARCRRLRRWALHSRSFDRGCKSLLDELRVHGLFTRWAKEAADKEALFATYQNQEEYLATKLEHPGALAERHAACGHARIRGDASLWAEEAGFDGVAGLAEALRRSAVVNDVQNRISIQVAIIEQAMAALLNE